jgi:hypothetical protein
MLAMVAVVGLAFPGCGKRVGLDTPVTPLAQIHFQVTVETSVPGADAGEQDVSSGPEADAGEQAPQLRVALMWGTQWLPEPFCVLPPESVAPIHIEADWKPPSADAVLRAGCPDNFRFVPDRVGADVALGTSEAGTIDLINLPAADVMVGDVTARIAYASLIVYDDRNGNGTLDFYHPLRRRHEEDYNPGTPATRDLPYGASFITMTQPDQRVAYREGAFDTSITGVAFYPRYRCGAPLPGFSILSAGGFSQSAALAAALRQELPEEDPTSCVEAKLDEAVVTIPLQPPPDPLQPPDVLKELACTVTDTGGTTFYREPPANQPNFVHVDWACVGFPHLPGDDAGVPLGSQLVIANGSTDACQSVNHYTLRGCDNDPSCAAPSWDVAATPPDWWPCP